MKKSSLLVVLGTLFAASTTFAQTAAPAVDASTTATVTATCKDGTTYSGTTMKGACHGHHGVNKRAGAAGSAAPASGTAAPAAKVSPVASSAAAASTVQAPGGGAGKVWVNTNSKAYHCSGDKYYGKTKAGEYMSEADAKSKGYHADHGKACG